MNVVLKLPKGSSTHPRSMRYHPSGPVTIVRPPRRTVAPATGWNVAASVTTHSARCRRRRCRAGRRDRPARRRGRPSAEDLAVDGRVDPSGRHVDRVVAAAVGRRGQVDGGDVGAEAEVDAGQRRIRREVGDTPLEPPDGAGGRLDAQRGFHRVPVGDRRLIVARPGPIATASRRSTSHRRPRSSCARRPVPRAGVRRRRVR